MEERLQATADRLRVADGHTAIANLRHDGVDVGNANREVLPSVVGHVDLQQVYLLTCKIQPCAGEREIGPVFAHGEPEHRRIELDGRSRVGDIDRHMMNPERCHGASLPDTCGAITTATIERSDQPRQTLAHRGAATMVRCDGSSSSALLAELGLSVAEQPVERLRRLMVDPSGIAEPRQVVALLARVPAAQRNEPICRFADAIVARTGDVQIASAAHRAAADALADDTDALCALIGSWLGIALNLRDPALLVELRQRASVLVAADGQGVAAAIVGIVDGASLFLQRRFRDVEASLHQLLADGVPAMLRGSIAMLRSLALQGQGLLDAAVAVLDADAATLGAFDLPAEIIRARRVWIIGDHRRALSMLAATFAAAQERGRQHDASVAASMARVFTRLAGDAPELPRPIASTPFIGALLQIEEALAMLPNERAAAALLEGDPVFISALPEMLAVPYVLLASMRERIDAVTSTSADPSDAMMAARLLVAKRAGNEVPRMSATDVRSLYVGWAEELLDVPPPTVAPAPLVRIRVLGPVSIDVDDVARSIRRERVRALITLLVLHRRTTRERLIDALWPDLAPLDGANNLRATLSYTRRLCPTHSIVMTDGQLVWLSDLVDVDLWDLDVSASNARRAAMDGSPASTVGELWARAADRVLGRFADDVRDASWLDVARFSIDTGSIDALLRAGNHLLVEFPARARQWADHALRIDPWSEGAHLLIVRSWLREGDTDSARRTLRRAADQMNDLGSSPSDAMQELARVLG